MRLTTETLTKAQWPAQWLSQRARSQLQKATSQAFALPLYLASVGLSMRGFISSTKVCQPSRTASPIPQRRSLDHFLDPSDPPGAVYVEPPLASL